VRRRAAQASPTRHPRTRGCVPHRIRAPCRAATQAIPPASLCLKRCRVKSRGVAWDTTGWGRTNRGAHGERVACPAAWVVRHAREGRPTQRPEGSQWRTWGSAPPGSGPQRWRRSRCSRRQRASTPSASGPHREPAGSLSSDCARQSLPLWEFSGALGRGRGDGTPAAVWRQGRSRGPLWRVGCCSRGGALRTFCTGYAGSTAGAAGSRPARFPTPCERGGAHRARAVASAYRYTAVVACAPHASACAAPPARPRAAPPAAQAGPVGQQTGRRAGPRAPVRPAHPSCADFCLA